MADIPAGLPDFIGRESLADVREIKPGLVVTYNGRPAVVCVPPLETPRFIGKDKALIRYLDGERERVLASPYECCVGWEENDDEEDKPF